MWKAFWRGFAGRVRQTGSSSSARALTQGEKAMPESDIPEGAIKEPPIEIDGRVMTAVEFVRHVDQLDFGPAPPTRIFLHHTWRPTAEEWRGRDSIASPKEYYERKLWLDGDGRVHEGWTAGPHLFAAHDGIWLFTDLRRDGVGVYGHNCRSRHVEIVDEYDDELPSGQALKNAIAALGILHERLGLDCRKICFHRDFSDKSCPGWAITKEWITPQVAEWIEGYRRSREKPMSGLRRALVRMARGLLGALTQEIPMEIDDRRYAVQLFAEALIVPVNEWDKVESLREYEGR